MSRQAPEIKHLAKTDPVMRRLIREVGPYTLTPRSKRSPFESLARAIAYQQLHEKAAESILRRFVALFPTKRFPQPADLLAIDERAIRGAGFSQAKVAALRDLAAKTLDGTVPTGCREHIICPVFVARDLSGLGWPLKEGHYDMGTGATGGETDAL